MSRASQQTFFGGIDQVIYCDTTKCAGQIGAPTRKEAEKLAGQRGWTVGPDGDFCRDCTDKAAGRA